MTHPDDATTRDILARLQRACAKQEQFIKNLREPLVPASVTNATQRSTTAHSEANSSVGDGSSRPSQFHVACERRWNQQFQIIVGKSNIPPQEKRAQVNAFLAEFQKAAAVVVEQFLAKYLGDEDDEGKPTRASQQLQWATATQIGTGQFLTVALLDCQDSTAFALVSKDYKAQLTVLSQNIAFSTTAPLVHVFPKAMVRFRGRALVVTAETSRVGDAVPAWQCPELVLAMAVASDTLNLSPYYLPRDDEDLQETAALLEMAVVSSSGFANARSQQQGGAVTHLYPHWGSLSAKARRGADGRLYIESLLDFFPHFPPAKNERINNRVHTLYLRPEAISRSPTPLSPAAFITYGTKDSTRRNADVRECTRLLCMHDVVTVAQTIDAVGTPTSAELRRMLHERGVNTSLLAIILTHLKRLEARTFVLSEMVVRASRDYLLREMSRHIELDDSRKAVSEFFAELSDPSSLGALWNDELAPRLAKKFPGFATFFGSGTPNYGAALALLDRDHLLRAVPPLVGVEFAKGVTASGTSTFHFCVTECRPVVKALQLPAEVFAGIGAVGNNAQVADICDQMSLCRPVDTPRTSMTLSYSLMANIMKHRRSSVAALSQMEGSGRASMEGSGRVDESDETVSKLHTKLSVYHAFERSTNSTSPPLVSTAPDVKLFLSQRHQFLGSACGGLPITNTIHNIFALLEAGAMSSSPTEAKTHLAAASTVAEKVLSGTNEARRRTPSTPGASGDSVRRDSDWPMYVTGGLIEARIHMALGAALEASGDAAGGIKAMENAFAIAANLNVPQEALGPAGGTSSGGANSARSRPTSSASQARRTSNSSRAYTPCGGESLADLDSGATPGYTIEAADIATILAGVMERHGMHEEASQHYEYALAAYSLFLGDVDGTVCAATNNLAVNYYSLGKFVEAERLYREDLRASELLFGPDSVTVAQTLNNLACLLDRVERGEESEPLYLRDIRITSKAYGDKHPDVATSRNNLGANYLKRGQLEKAEELLRQALEARKTIFGERSVGVAEVMNNIGALYKSQNKKQEAVDTWRATIEIYEERLGQNNPATLSTLENLLVLVEEMGDYAAAEKVLESIQELKRQESATYFATKKS